MRSERGLLKLYLLIQFLSVIHSSDGFSEGFSCIRLNEKRGYKYSYQNKNTSIDQYLHQRSAKNHQLKPIQTQLHALVPLRTEDLEDVISFGMPTGEQYSSYWGQTSREVYNTLFENGSVTFLGLWASYFLSFIVGQSIATIFGSFAAMWILLGPEVKAYYRNAQLLGGRDLVDIWTEDEYGEPAQGLFGSAYFAAVSKVCVVEDDDDIDEYDLTDFSDYTMERDDLEAEIGTPWKLRLLLKDSSGRELQVHTRLSEQYLDIEEGMPAAAVLLSPDEEFTNLAGLTDFYIPDVGAWVGDYPYLDRNNFMRYLVNPDILNLLESERDDFMFEEEEEDYDTATTAYGNGDSSYKGNK